MVRVASSSPPKALCVVPLETVRTCDSLKLNLTLASEKYISLYHLSPSSIELFSLFQSQDEGKPETEMPLTTSQRGCHGGQGGGSRFAS